ncbi:MAG: hypothetical protein AB1476_01070 [Candidatus Hadarchaeota archaeon]
MASRHLDREWLLAEHGRWIAQLRDDFALLDQRLRSLERRLSRLEAGAAESAEGLSR